MVLDGRDVTIDKITDIAASLLKKRGVERRPLAGDSLREAGLASLDMVNLVLAIEDAFDVVIPEERLTPDALRSLASLRDLVLEVRDR